MSRDLIRLALKIRKTALQYRDAFLQAQNACAEVSANLAPSLPESVAAFGLRLAAGAPIDEVLQASIARRARFATLVAGLSDEVSIAPAETDAVALFSTDVIPGLVVAAARAGGAARPALAPSLFHDRAPETSDAHTDPGYRERLGRILDRVERVEQARLEEAAADTEVLGLMALGANEGEMLRLSVRATDRGLDAIRRLGASFEEAASVFKSLGDAAAALQQEMAVRGDGDDRRAGATTERVDQSVDRVDEVFVRQAAQWTAAQSLSEAIQKSCAAARAGMSSSDGAYMTRDQLQSFMPSASDRMRLSIAEREADVRSRLSQVELCRAQLREA